MHIVNIKQGTPEWHEFRKGHLGATDCAAIMGECEYGGNQLKLYNEKMGLIDVTKRVTPSMQHGIDTEDEAREFYCNKFDTDWIPVVGESEDYPFMMASFDGWDGFTVLEIKCVGENTFRKAQNNEISKNYLWQIRHQLCVSEAQAAILGFYYKTDEGIETHEICFGRDEDAIARLAKVEQTFWYENISQWSPPVIKRKPRKARMKSR